jgi:hypothetical protein
MYSDRSSQLVTGNADLHLADTAGRCCMRPSQPRAELPPQGGASRARAPARPPAARAKEALCPAPCSPCWPRWALFYFRSRKEISGVRQRPVWCPCRWAKTEQPVGLATSYRALAMSLAQIWPARPNWPLACLVPGPYLKGAGARAFLTSGPGGVFLLAQNK